MSTSTYVYLNGLLPVTQRAGSSGVQQMMLRTSCNPCQRSNLEFINTRPALSRLQTTPKHEEEVQYFGLIAARDTRSRGKDWRHGSFADPASWTHQVATTTMQS